MTARDIALDINGDWTVSKGDIRFVSDADAIVQAVSIALQFFKGEWFLDLDAGVSWFQDVLIKNPNPNVLHSVFREAIANVEGITEVTALTLTLDNVTRTLAVSWRANSDVGALSSTVEV